VVAVVELIMVPQLLELSIQAVAVAVLVVLTQQVAQVAQVLLSLVI
jgi:hypothetical protein